MRGTIAARRSRAADPTSARSIEAPSVTGTVTTFVRRSRCPVYSTCLFCNQGLGRNDVLEHFPVGRRLAYDEARGRLWVVCRRCGRWNLTPLEARWEAIEEAERCFRASRLRMSTENIGLARVGEGLELVRVGKPPRLELAGWRYGDQFGRRRRRWFLRFGAGVGYSILPIAFLTHGPTIGLIGSGLIWSQILVGYRNHRRDTRVPTALLDDGAGGQLWLTQHDTWSSLLVPIRETGGWCLSVKHRERGPEQTGLRSFVFPRGRPQVAEPTILRGDVAKRAIATLLPRLSPTDGSARHVREANGVIESFSTVHQLLYAMATRGGVPSSTPGANPLTRIPARDRLALEMVLHDDEERRAMEGELAALEQRWRDAEQIAAIADSLLLPADTETRFAALKRLLRPGSHAT